MRFKSLMRLTRTLILESIQKNPLEETLAKARIDDDLCITKLVQEAVKDVEAYNNYAKYHKEETIEMDKDLLMRLVDKRFERVFREWDRDRRYELKFKHKFSKSYRDEPKFPISRKAFRVFWSPMKRRYRYPLAGFLYLLSFCTEWPLILAVCALSGFAVSATGTRTYH